MTRSISFLAVLSLVLAAPAADEKKPDAAAKPAVTAEAPATPAAPAEAKVHAPTDLATLKPLVGQKIVLEGKVANAGANKTESIRYLNFTPSFRDSVSLVFFANTGGGTFTKDKLATYVGKKVRANGTLSEFNGALQIKMESLDQLKVIEEPAPPAAPPAPATPAK